MIAIIDYDIGNLGAVENMLHRLGIPCEITARPETIKRADRIILPGNGAFDACVTALRASGLVPLLEARALRDRIPVLGICVGAQILGKGSEEGTEAGWGGEPCTTTGALRAGGSSEPSRASQPMPSPAPAARAMLSSRNLGAVVPGETCARRRASRCMRGDVASAPGS